MGPLIFGGLIIPFCFYLIPYNNSTSTKNNTKALPAQTIIVNKHTVRNLPFYADIIKKLFPVLKSSN